MSSDFKKNPDPDNVKEEIQIPDFTELWKEMYFKTESAWAEAFKELISTQTFVGLINKSLDQHLSNEKVSRQIIDKYMEMSPVPSKKDISRVAELVISLEEKIDEMEFQFTHTMASMADSLLKMVDYQAGVKDELNGLRQDLSQIEKKLDNLNKKVTAVGKEPRATKKKTTAAQPGELEEK